MIRKKLSSDDVKKLSKIIKEKIETDVFIVKEDDYIYFTCYDELNGFTIGKNRFIRLAILNKKDKTKDFETLLNLLNNY